MAHYVTHDDLANMASTHIDRVNKVDVRSMLLTGFAIVQGAVDIMFAVWWHGR